MKLYFGKSIDDKTLIAKVEDEQQANVEMVLYLKDQGCPNPYYWRMWDSEDEGCRTYDFGSWTYFFFLYK